ncbi:MAG: hypothetical protein IPJ90_12430 [Anaerolineaceae bacterium]|nr:hypothetical protein [Anaerolineaceae bacterium]
MAKKIKMREKRAESTDEINRDAEVARIMAELEAISQRVTASWKSDKSALEALEADRQGSFERLFS